MLRPSFMPTVSLMGASERFDVVVVGAGAMGSATAWHLARDGRSVALLEQFEPGHVRGSSHGEVRIFRVAYRDARYTDLALRALPMWQLLGDESGDVLLEQDGQLDHGYTEAIDEIERNLAAAGRPYERLGAAEAHARWPGMHFDESVIFSPEGGRAYASRTVSALVAQARRHGALVRHGVRVERVSVQRDDRACVHTADGSYEASAVVVAAGAWAAKLLGETVRLPPLTVTCEQPAHFAPRARTDIKPWPAFLHHVAPAEGERGHTLPLGFGAYGLF